METEDEIRAAVTASMRTAIMLAAQIGERAARAAEQREREIERAAEQQRRELTARLDADRSLALAQMAPAHDPRWWDTASQDDIAGAYAAAKAWEARDSEAGRAAERIRTEVRDRYGIDLNQPDARIEVAGPVAAVEARAKGGRDEAEARALLAAGVVAEREGDHDQAQGERQHAGVVYDSAQRREAMRAALNESEVGVEAALARVTAAKGQAHPQEAAAAKATRASRSRTTRFTRGRTGRGLTP